MKNNKVKMSIGIIILIIIIIGIFSVILFNKNEKEKKAKAFEQKFIEAENVNVGKNNNLNNLFGLYEGKANEIMNHTNNKFTDEDYQTLYGKIELSEVSGDKLIKLENDLEKNIVQNTDLNTKTSLDNQQKIWDNYLSAENNAIKKEKEDIRLANRANNYLSLTANVVYFNIYNYLDNNGINPQFSSNYFQNELASVGNSSNKINLTESQKNYINKKISAMNCIEIQANNIINGAVGNKTSIVDAYNKIDTMWSNYLNEEYKELKEQSPYKNIIINNEIPWTNFKTDMCNQIATQYTSPTEKELAKTRMDIRLTEQQAFNLLSYS